jgi:hypothetical protein
MLAQKGLSELESVMELVLELVLELKREQVSKQLAESVLELIEIQRYLQLRLTQRQLPQLDLQQQLFSVTDLQQVMEFQYQLCR